MLSPKQRSIPQPIKAILFDVDSTLVDVPVTGVTDASMTIVDEAIECLRTLKQQGIIMVLIGQRSQTDYEHIFGDDFNVFDVVIDCQQPSLEAIALGLAIIECHVAEALFVGNPCPDAVLAPNAVGIKTVWMRIAHNNIVEPSVRPDYIIFSMMALTELAVELTRAAHKANALLNRGWNFVENITTGTGALLVMRVRSSLGFNAVAKIYNEPQRADQEAQALVHLSAGAPTVLDVEDGLLLLADLGEDDGRVLSSTELVTLLESLNSGGALEGTRSLIADVYQPYQQRLLDSPSMAPWAKVVAATAWQICSDDITPPVLCHGDLHRGNIHSSAQGINILDPRPANGSRLFDMVLYCTTQHNGDVLFEEIMKKNIYHPVLANAWFEWTLIHRVEDRFRYGHVDALRKLEGMVQRRWNQSALLSDTVFKEH